MKLVQLLVKGKAWPAAGCLRHNCTSVCFLYVAAALLAVPSQVWAWCKAATLGLHTMLVKEANSAC